MRTGWKVWAKFGLGAALVTSAVSACSQAPPDESAAVSQPPVISSPEDQASSVEPRAHGGEAGHSMDALPVEKRVAFMSGHVKAGLALFRAGALEEAAPHLLHPVSETHAAERADIEALGFDQQIFVAVSAALEAGRPAEEIEPQLAAADANITLMQQNAGGDPVEIIAYLMDTVLEEYRIGVSNGAITDPGEYQDAYGFTLVALEIARRIEGKETTGLISDLESLLALWPEDAPLASSVPSPVTDLVAKISQIHIALGTLQAER